MKIREFLSSNGACWSSLDWLGNRGATRETWAACERVDWMMFLADIVGIDRRRIVLAAAACAWAALPKIPKNRNRRARVAIDLARRYGLGQRISEKQLAAARANARRAVDALTHEEKAYNNASWAAFKAVDAAEKVAMGEYGAGSDACITAREAAIALGSDKMPRLCRYIRHCIGWPRLREALIAKGVEVGP